MRITKKVFTDQGLFMMSFGLIIGIIFPFFTLMFGVPSLIVMSFGFFASCIGAGMVVGAFNLLISKVVVGNRLKLLASKTTFIAGHLNSKMSNDEIDQCTQETCKLVVDSEDEIGESAQAFNNLVENLSKALKTENSIKRFNEVLNSQLDIDAIAQKGMEQLITYLDAQGGAVLLERGGDLFVEASYAIKDVERLVNNDVIWKSVKTAERQVLHMQKEIVVDQSLVEFFPSETIIEPLVYKGIALGVIILACSHEIPQDLLYGFEMCIRTFTLSLRNAVTYEQLQHLAANDPLTGVYNRRFGMVRLKEEYNRSVRGNLPLGVLMVDIDHFKSVNDTYGHTIGDKILFNMTRVAKLALREGDILLRYGGEEFMVIMPGASRQDSEFVADRLRRMVEESSAQHGDQQISVTVSIGVVSCPETDVTDESKLIVFADNALYEAKEKGRNRVVLY